ncbi:molecular chaperone DnaK [Kocuria palustris]|nr:molecular chaperone DnaK [Kocuria palustris]
MLRGIYGRHAVNRIAKRYNSILGIDLGTTNLAVAVNVAGQPRILDNEDGAATTPSVVAYTGSDVLVGAAAKRQTLINPRNTFFATKRLIGRKFSDAEVQRDIGHVPYKITSDAAGDAVLETDNGRELTPQAIGADILAKMKTIAANHGYTTSRAVVTVPAYFNDSQRLATRELGKQAGLEVVRVVNEPTAAALAYGLRQENDGIVAVFDLGGGTFDISILDIELGIFEVRATHGDTHLGGEDFDIRITNLIIDQIRLELGVDVSGDRLAVTRIREAAEKCKMALDSLAEYTVELPFITDKTHFKATITQKQLHELCQPLVDKTTDPVKRCLRDAGLKPKDIDQVLLVGGMTKMPLVRDHVAKLFQCTPLSAVNPDEAVALGAAVQGAILAGELKDVVLLDVTPLTLGIETYGGIFSPLIPRNTAVPCSVNLMFSTAVDGQTGVEINVYQGERQLAKDNKRIGKFTLGGIPLAPKGVPQISVEFKIDPDGIINVSATDKTPTPDGTPAATDKLALIQVLVDNSLTPEEVEKLVLESQAHATEDTQWRQLYEHCSRADILLQETKDFVARFGHLMDPEQRQAIEGHMALIQAKLDDVRVHGKMMSAQVINDELNLMQRICLTEVQKIALDQQKSLQVKGDE